MYIMYLNLQSKFVINSKTINQNFFKTIQRYICKKECLLEFRISICHFILMINQINKLYECLAGTNGPKAIKGNSIL